jgi:hypothetical protein
MRSSRTLRGRLSSVREAFGDEYERAGGRFRHVVREPEAQAPVEHVHELVLADMHVQRRALTRLGAALPDRERAPCLLAARLVRQRSAPAGLSTVRPSPGPLPIALESASFIIVLL